jgi:hypothetical protein
VDSDKKHESLRPFLIQCDSKFLVVSSVPVHIPKDIFGISTIEYRDVYCTRSELLLGCLHQKMAAGKAPKFSSETANKGHILSGI